MNTIAALSIVASFWWPWQPKGYFQWDPPTTYTDGTPMVPKDVWHYNLYESDGTLYRGGISFRSRSINVYKKGCFYFTAVARRVDEKGKNLESGPSKQICTD